MSGRRQYPWVLVDQVPWAEGAQYTRGTYEGLHLLSWGIAPRGRLATYRQLRAMELRPGGVDPVAVLFFHSRRGRRMVFASLYLIAAAKPVRPMTDAKWCAVAAARAARCTCPTCPPGRQIKPYCLPTSRGQCWDCLFRNDSDAAGNGLRPVPRDCVASWF